MTRQVTLLFPLEGDAQIEPLSNAVAILREAGYLIDQFGLSREVDRGAPTGQSHHQRWVGWRINGTEGPEVEVPRKVGG